MSMHGNQRERMRKRPRDGGWEGERENETGQNKRQMSLMYQW